MRPSLLFTSPLLACFWHLTNSIAFKGNLMKLLTFPKLCLLNAFICIYALYRALCSVAFQPSARHHNDLGIMRPLRKEICWKNQSSILSFSECRSEEWGGVVWAGWHYSYLDTLVGSRDGFNNWVVLSDPRSNFSLLPCNNDPPSAIAAEGWEQESITNPAASGSPTQFVPLLDGSWLNLLCPQCAPYLLPVAMLDWGYWGGCILDPSQQRLSTSYKLLPQISQ